MEVKKKKKKKKRCVQIGVLCSHRESMVAILCPTKQDQSFWMKRKFDAQPQEISSTKNISFESFTHKEGKLKKHKGRSLKIE